MNFGEAADLYFKYLQPITIATGVLICLVSFLWRHADEAYAIDSIAKGLTFSTFPGGVAFLICAAFPSYVPKVADATPAFFVGGLALMLIPFIDFKKLFQADN